jgi:hypothetical protein
VHRTTMSIFLRAQTPLRKREKNPAVGEMEEESDELCAVAIGCEDGAKHVWNIHPCHADSLAAGENGGQDDGASKTPQ